MITLQKQPFAIDILEKALRVAFAFFFTCLGVKAADTTETSAKVYRMAEVEVNADRVQISPISKFSSSYFMNKMQLKNIGAISVDEILSKSPGVFIKNYGGAGGLKSVSMRGTDPAQNLIMIDGVAINSAQNAMYDLSLFPASFVNSMEVIRGGSSDTYGANAIGGVVNFITENYTEEDKFAAGITVASYDEYNVNAEYSTTYKGVYAHLGGEYLKSKGNYEFEFNQNGKDVTLNRENAEFENIALNLVLGGNPTDNLKINFKSIMSTCSRGVPGAVVQNRVESLYASLDESNVLNILSLTQELGRAGVLKFTGVAKFSQQHYTDDSPNAFSSMGNSMFINKELRGMANYSYALSNFTFRLNSEYNFAELTGDMLDKSVGRYVKRANFSLNTLLEHRWRLSENWRYSASPSLRLDVFSDNSPEISSGLGLLLANDAWQSEMKVRVSQNFRMPSFNELYYYNYGTANLKPEKSQSLTVAVSKRLFGMMKVEVSGFYIDTKNRIISVPKNTISWSAQNLGRAETIGTEISATGNLFSEDLVFNLSYTLQWAKDKSDKSLNYDKYIVYTPREILNFGLDRYISQFLIRVECEYASHRFSMPDNSYGAMLPRYCLFGAGVAYTFDVSNVKAKIKLDCKNIFDKQYCVISNYPMPGRTFRLTLSVNN